jgi:hypothetical protein
VVPDLVNDAFDIPALKTGKEMAEINVAGGASGGTLPYTFSATGLPEGVTISAAGVISGTPTAVSDAGTATITVTDAAGATATMTINFGSVKEPMNTMLLIAAVIVIIAVMAAIVAYAFIGQRK